MAIFLHLFYFLCFFSLLYTPKLMFNTVNKSVQCCQYPLCRNKKFFTGKSLNKLYFTMHSKEIVTWRSNTELALERMRKMWRYLLLICCQNVFTAQIKLHNVMSREELRSIFHIDNIDHLPEYQIVNIHTRTKRDIISSTSENNDNNEKRILKINVFGRNLDLNLEKNNNLMKNDVPLYSVVANSSGHLEYQLLTHQEPLGETYQDVNNQAAFIVHTDPKDGATLYEGTIGRELVLKPLPSSLRQKMAENEIDDANIEKSHVIYKRKQQDKLSHYSDYAFMEPGDLTGSRRKKRALRKKREAPYVIYPEILVIVDYDGYRLHGGDNVQIKRYFISFWNGVDLRYKLLKGPKVRISIAGIIISRGRDATPYLERNRVGRDAIDSAAALTDMGKYLFRERRLPVYDIAVAITKYDMCRRRKGGRCTKGTAGFAYVGGACVVNKRLEKVNSVAIIEDTGGFSGIIVAAHEVGHLLGAVHDGSPPPTYLGGPGAERCRWEDGYIMSDLRHTEKGFRWSPCSVSSFHHFLNGDTATCLYNSPHEDETLPRVLPGKLLSLDAQCRRDRGTSACFKDERVCAQLFCFDSGSGYCVAYRPAAEGSPCGDGQICNSGRCQVEHENIIPDYSQQTVSYVRRNGETVSLDGNTTTTSRKQSVL